MDSSERARILSLSAAGSRHQLAVCGERVRRLRVRKHVAENAAAVHLGAFQKIADEIRMLGSSRADEPRFAQICATSLEQQLVSARKRVQGSKGTLERLENELLTCGDQAAAMARRYDKTVDEAVRSESRAKCSREAREMEEVAEVHRARKAYDFITPTPVLSTNERSADAVGQSNVHTLIRERIEKFAVWRHLTQSGAHIDYRSARDSHVSVHLQSLNEDAVRVVVTPSHAVDHQALWRERGRIIKVLSDQGISVRDFIVQMTPRKNDAGYEGSDRDDND